MSKRKIKITGSVVTLALLSNICAGDTLHNGIELPDQWPPRIEHSREPMPVPYLDTPPELIPIDIGRQLFVDDFLVEETNLTRTYHRPRYHPANPILHFDQPWELVGNPRSGMRGDAPDASALPKQGTLDGKAMAAPFSDGVWYDPSDHKFKIWYMGGALQATGYAESKNGVDWTKPELDVVPGTNIVLEEMRDSTTVWLDHHATDPTKRYLLFSIWDPWRFVLRYSKDGIHWSEPVARSPRVNDRSTIYRDPFRNKWIASIRTNGRKRDYRENDDVVGLLGWTDEDRYQWVSADRLDPRNPDYPDVDPQLYNHDAAPYESLMLGFFSIWQGPSNSVAQELSIPKRNEVLLGFSRDGFHWHRPDRRPFLGVNQTEGAWNWGNVQSVGGGCIVVGDELYFYASGRQKNEVSWDGYMSTGMASLRRDGFASMDANERGGTLTTRPITFDGYYLYVNAATAEGKMHVEILDEAGDVIEPFSIEKAQSISVDSTLVRVNWDGATDLSALSGKPIRLRFHLTNGSLYSFWVSPDENGSSHGYVCGGGPGFLSDRDTVGVGAYEAADSSSLTDLSPDP